MYQCFVSAGGNGIGGGRNMAGIAAAGGYRQEAQASSELRLGGKKIYNVFSYFKLIVNYLFKIVKHVRIILSNVANLFENICIKNILGFGRVLSMQLIFLYKTSPYN